MNSTSLRTITKEELITKFKDIEALKWIKNKRGNNDGAVGNTLEDLLGIPENNLPIPNAVEWELKAQRANTSSLVTLFHKEPSPTAVKLVPTLLLPKYGWRHQKAGTLYSETEKSFRQTLNGNSYTDRGFKVVVNETEQKIAIDFNPDYVDISKHKDWFEGVKSKVEDIHHIEVQPYWGFQDLFAKAGTKLINCFYVKADTKKENGIEFFHYNNVMMLKEFQLPKFIEAIRLGKIYIDFDARTQHNHGTKFRIHFDDIPYLYNDAIEIINVPN